MQSAPETIRLLTIDIDGTLLDPHKRLTPRTCAAIRAARAEGIIVSLATARRYNNSRPYLDELELAGPHITYDGALIVTHPHKTIIHQHPLAARVAQEAVDIIARHHVQPIIHRFTPENEGTWTGMPDQDHPELLGYISAYPDTQRLPCNMLCADLPDPLRVVAFATPEMIAPMLPEIAALDCSWYSIPRGNYGCGELIAMHKTCTKATGVIALAQYLNIPLSQVMAIGDNINDLAMLQAVGFGVAMGHAPAIVQEAAHAVTASNREDGVALAIERYALRDRYASSNSLNRATW